jgi:hypothetical protein
METESRFAIFKTLQGTIQAEMMAVASPNLTRYGIASPQQQHHQHQ